MIEVADRPAHFLRFRATSKRRKEGAEMKNGRARFTGMSIARRELPPISLFRFAQSMFPFVGSFASLWDTDPNMFEVAE